MVFVILLIFPFSNLFKFSSSLFLRLELLLEKNNVAQLHILLFYDFINRIIIIVNFKRLFNNKRLQNSFSCNPFFLVKRATETVDNNRNYYRRCSLIICAVPLRTGLKDFVVLVKSITQPSLSAILMFSVSFGFTSFY
jgi:hypothetical protein